MWTVRRRRRRGDRGVGSDRRVGGRTIRGPTMNDPWLDVISGQTPLLGATLKGNQQA
jgi:hypothetical protein